MKRRVQWHSSVLAKSAFGALICVGLFLFSSPKAISQTFYGSIVGTVSDSTGAVVPGTNITLTNLGTTEKRTMETDAAGSYRFVNLVPGKYRIEAEKTGFKRFAREHGR